ncbi:MAG: hypothetical protein NC123_07695 [Butyrivibrio sp.]|nr:hypothetical protein [Acetatifactor muris]MCM1559414.1 hypothetical protein [Butyrivibrio sp.]
MKREVYWHLPGFCYFRLLNQILLNLMKDYPECFREGYRIGSVYGAFPGAIWNGGRAVFGSAGKQEIESVLRIYNSRGIPVRFTWTNGLLKEKHLEDPYCNLIMKLADNGLNQALVNAPVLEEYLRRRYPAYPLISSTTKRITGVEGLLEELEKDYFLVVLDYDLNHDREALEAAEKQAGRVEILVNEICFPGCPRRAEHYRHQSLAQLGELGSDTEFPCPNRSRNKSLEDCKKRPAFISAEEIGDYADRGFVNFKIMGRGMPQDFVKETYLYYLVKDESREFIRGKMEGLLLQLRRAMTGK